MRRTALLAGMLATLCALTVAAAPAAAAGSAPSPLGCDASALRGTVLGTSIEPVTANHGQAACQSITASLGDLTQTLGLPPVVTGVLAGAAEAQTTNQGTAGQDGQDALADGGVSNLDVKSLPGLPITLPAPPDLSQYASVTVPLPSALATLLALPPINFSGPLTLDLRPELQALLPNLALPNLDLVHLQTVNSKAEAKCVAGRTQMTGISQVAGISALGMTLPTDQVVNQALTLVSASQVSPSSIDPSTISLPSPLSLTDPTYGAALTDAIQAELNSLPAVQIPALLGNVMITPEGQSVSGGMLTQQALRLQVSVLGQSLVDLILGEARVADAGASCAPPAPPPPPPSSPMAGGPATATQLALECTTRKLTLIDVLRQGDRVELLGAADHRYIGRVVDIVFTTSGQTVARATVNRDGSFEASAPLPPPAVRDTNQARYQARIGGERSLNLKLNRRMLVTSMSSSGGLVTIAGTITRPVGNPPPVVTVTRRLTCNTNQVVARFRPATDGRFKVSIAAPKGVTAAVYRLSTRVPKTPRNPKLFPTFTLPRAVNLIG